MKRVRYVIEVGVRNGPSFYGEVVLDAKKVPYRDANHICFILPTLEKEKLDRETDSFIPNRWGDGFYPLDERVEEIVAVMIGDTGIDRSELEYRVSETSWDDEDPEAEWEVGTTGGATEAWMKEARD